MCNNHPPSKIVYVLLFAAFFLAFAVSGKTLYAQERQEGRCIIAGVEYSIHGRTSTYALAKLLDITIGKEFGTFEDLRIYIIEKERILKDNRVFAESSHIEIEPDSPMHAASEPVPVHIHVYAEDTWTALFVPIPKFNQADGLSLALRYKDFNFLGTLNPITASLDYYVITQTVDVGTEFDIYPVLLGNNWSAALSAYLRYKPDEGVHFHDSSASLSSTYALNNRWSLTPSFSYQYIDANKEHIAHAIQTVNYTFGRTLDWNTGLQTGYQFDSTAAVPHQWTGNAYLNAYFPLFTMPSQAQFGLTTSATLFGSVDLASLKPYDAGLGSTLSLGYSAVDWRGNFRRGSFLRLSETSNWYVLRPTASRPWDLLVDVSASFFTSFKNLVGLDFRALSRWNAGWTLTGDTSYKTSMNWGEYLRGISATLYGDIAAIINLQFPVNFAQGRFFHWSKLEAEVFLIPFVDAGYVRPSPDVALWRASDFYMAAGADMVVFPLYARSFTYRLSVGYNVLDMIRNNRVSIHAAEVWLGIGLHF